MGAGEELIELGWRQGSSAKLGIEVIPSSVLKDGRWEIATESLQEDDQVVIVSQSCDIERDSVREPYLVGMRAFWTRDDAIIAMARGNSWRYFRLRTLEGKGSLVADASRTMLITKESLVSLAPEHNLEDAIGDEFRSWVASRYGRVALEREVVEGIQRPIVQTVQRRKGEQRLRRVMDSMKEVRVFWHAEDRIELFLIPLPGQDLVLSDVAALANAMCDAVRGAGYVQTVDWNVEPLENLSADEYLNSVHMPLDHYSLPEAAPQPAARELEAGSQADEEPQQNSR